MANSDFGNLAPLMWAGLILATVELGLEYRAFRRGYDSPLGKLISIRARSNDSSRGTVKYGPTESFPFRSRIVEPKHTQVAARVWIASASYAEDVYQPVEAIFPSLIENELSEGGRSCQVLNAGRAGVTIRRNIADFKQYGKQWSPNVVVLYQMGTDITKQSNLRNQAPPKSNNDGDVDQGKTTNDTSWSATKVFESTTLYGLLKSNVSARLYRYCILSNGLQTTAKIAIMKDIRDFVASVEDMGGTPVLCTFATSHPLEIIEQIPTSHELSTLRFAPGMSMNGWASSIRELNNRIRAFAKNNGVLLVDVDAAVSGTQAYFRDFVHFTPEGHEAVAREIARVIRDGYLMKQVPSTGRQ